MAESLSPTPSTKTRRSRITILAQVLLATGIVLVLAVAIAITGYTSLRSFQNATSTTLYEANQVRALSALVQSYFLQARQSEAEFMNTWRVYGISAETEAMVSANAENLSQARFTLTQLETLIGSSSDVEIAGLMGSVNELRVLFDDYEQAFQTTVELIEERSAVTGVDAGLRTQIESLLDALSPVANSTYIQLVYEMQQNEMNYLATRTPASSRKPPN
jgi:hypothetical protein